MGAVAAGSGESGSADGLCVTLTCSSAGRRTFGGFYVFCRVWGGGAGAPRFLPLGILSWEAGQLTSSLLALWPLCHRTGTGAASQQPRGT